MSIQYWITVYPAQPYISLCYWGADEIDEKYRQIAFMTMMTMPAEGNGSCWSSKCNADDGSWQWTQNCQKEKCLNKVCKVDRGAVGVGPIGAQTLAETWSLHCY